MHFFRYSKESDDSSSLIGSFSFEIWFVTAKLPYKVGVDSAFLQLIKMCETIQKESQKNLEQSRNDAALEYSKSVNYTSNISKASTITFLPEEWSSVISVETRNPAVGNNLPKLASPIQNRMKQLGLTSLRTGQSFLKPRIHKYQNSNSVYHGEVIKRGQEELPHGSGNLYIDGGSFFSGTFANGLANGPGRLFLPNGNYYEGSFNNNIISGYGRYIEGQTTYEGGFKNGVIHGRGVLTCPTAVFTGNYVDGQKYEGVLVWGQNKEYTYQGRFDNDLFNGKGFIKSPDGTFQGNFENGHKKGYGIFKWSNRSRYQGEYENDLRHGFGEYFNSQGDSKYRGFWLNDKPYVQVLQQQEDPRKSSQF